MREHTDLEKKLSDVSHRLFYLQYRKHYRKKTSLQAIYTALYYFKYTPDCTYNKITSGEWRCIFKLLNVEIGSGSGGNKQKAKAIAFQNGCKNLTKPYCRVVQLETNYNNLILETADSPFPEILNPVNAMEEFLSDSDNHQDNRMHLKMNPENILDIDLSKFIIFKFTDANRSEVTSYATLLRSANFSEILLEMDLRVQNGEFDCIVSIGGQPLVEATARNKVTVKEVASEKALEYLSSIGWTLYKKRKGNKNKNINLESALLEIEKLKNTSGLSDIYNKSPNEHKPDSTTFVTREGFAKKNTGKDMKFIRAVQMAIQEHISFSSTADLAFDSTFTHNEKEKICKGATKFDVVVSKKFMNHQIYTVISKKEGAENEVPNMISIGYLGYFLVPPKTGKCTVTPLNVQDISPETALDHDSDQEIAQDDQERGPDTAFNQECGSEIAQYDRGLDTKKPFDQNVCPETAHSDLKFAGFNDQGLSHGQFKQEKGCTEFQNTNIHHEINPKPAFDASQLQNVENVSSSKRQAISQQGRDIEQLSKKIRPNIHPNMPYYRPRLSSGRPDLPYSFRPPYQGPPPHAFPPHANRPRCQQPYDRRQWYTDDYCEDLPYSQGPVWFN